MYFGYGFAPPHHPPSHTSWIASPKEKAHLYGRAFREFCSFLTLYIQNSKLPGVDRKNPELYFSPHLSNLQEIVIVNPLDNFSPNSPKAKGVPS
jgi:hypothetical protein